MDEDARKRLREAGQIIKDKAHEIASATTNSVRIPASLEMTEDEYAVIIRANPEIAPQARAFELPVRHPLWATGGRSGWKWGPTPHRPFLEPAVDQTADKAAEKCAMVIEDWTEKLGYHK